MSDVLVVDVGDFELAPSGLDGGDHLEHVGVVSMDASDALGSGGSLGLPTMSESLLRRGRSARPDGADARDLRPASG